MSDINYYTVSLMVKQREQEALERARISQMIAESKVDRPGWRQRFFNKLGHGLVVIGQKLEARYPICPVKPVVQTASNAGTGI